MRTASALMGTAAVFLVPGGLLAGAESPARAAAGSCAVLPALPPPPAERPTYAIRIRLSQDLKSATGTMTVVFQPSVATDRVVFRLWPNSPFYARRGARLTVGAVTSGGSPLSTARPDPTTLVVRRALAAGERVTVSMPWALYLPRGTGSQLEGGGRSARLVSFFPLLAWDGAGWATDPPLRFQDSFWPASPTADFDVHVVETAGARVLATGREVAAGHWRAQSVRDFALAVGSFVVRRSTVRLPRPVRVVVALERGSSYSLGAFVSDVARSLRLYGQRYGAYPWPSYTLVLMRDIPTAVAYPTIAFLADSSFGLVLVPHETAHQWFYSLVGNDQARDPWLSEGLATWAQTGVEGSLATMLGTAIPPAVRNRIGEPMSFWDPRGFEKLRLGVYVQTVQALNDLGDASVVDCALRQFVVENAYRTAVPRDLLAALEPFFPDAEQKLTARGAHF